MDGGNLLGWGLVALRWWGGGGVQLDVAQGLCCVVVEAGEQKCMMQHSCAITFVGVGNFTQFGLQF